MDSPERIRMATEGMHSVEVSFDHPAAQEKLGNLPGVTSVSKTGDKVRLYMTDPGGLVHTLAEFASSEGLKIVSLNTPAPSLEDAFVALTEEVKGGAR